ncbi:glycosyltransferase [Actinotalea sp. AC32]|nr:glycosyltransferase [Actinotalea sp. AC32]
MTDGSASAAVPRRPRTSSVTVVVVTRGDTEYASETLTALAAQARPPAHVLLVDVGAEPAHDARTLAAQLFAGPDAPSLSVVEATRARTFGAAVRAGLDAGSDVLGRDDWLWLLHDDSAPAPDALAELMRAVEIAPSVGVAGCKQRTWSGPARVLEVGVSTSRFGRRMTGIEGAEVDQGQYDGREDVLAVGIAGALVRRDVWDALGGPDPALGPFGDGADLCRRARLAGHRVVVVPRAVVRHAQASLADPVSGAVVNRPGWDARRSARARREAYLHGQLVGVPLPLVPVVTVLAVVSGVVRALGRLVSKEPHLVIPELVAPWSVLVRPLRVIRARRRDAATRRLPRRSLRPLQVTWREVVRQTRDRRLSAAERRRHAEAPSELELRELAALRRRRRGTGLLVLLGAVGVTTAVLGPLVTRVLAGERLTGGTLPGAASSAVETWRVVRAAWVPADLGHPGPVDPALLATLPLAAVAGSLSVGIGVVVLLSLVLAAVGAWFAAGAATRSVGLRAWAALVWTAAPSLLVGVADVRWGAVLAHVLLPWVLLGVARGVGAARVDVVASGLLGAQRLVDRAPDAPPVPGTLAVEDRWAGFGDDAEDVEGVDDVEGADGTADSDDPEGAEVRSEDAEEVAGPGRSGGPGGSEAADAVPARSVPTQKVHAPAPAAQQPGPTQAVPAHAVPAHPVPPHPVPALLPVRRAPASLAALAGGSLALAAASAGAPVLLPAALLLVPVLALVVPRRRVLWLPVPALALHAPVVVEALRTWGDGGWRALLADPGVPVASTAAPAWQQLLGHPVVPDALPWFDGVVAELALLAAGGVLVLVAALALTRGSALRAACVGWAAAAVGLLGGAVAGRAVVARSGEALVAAWPGGAVSLVVAGLGVAALVGADGLRSRLARRSFGWRQLTAGLLTVLAVLAPLVVLGTWTYQALVAPGTVLAARTTDVAVVPAVGRQLQASPDDVRVLAVGARTAEEVTATLLRDDGAQLVEWSRTVTAREVAGSWEDPVPVAPDDAEQELLAVVGTLVTGTGDGVAQDLALLGVGAVLVPPTADVDASPVAVADGDQDGGADAVARTARTELVARLDATPGLERVTETESGIIWRVAPGAGTTTAWARLVGGGDEQPVASDDGTVRTRIEPGGTGGERRLVLAERADPAWRATLDGRPLRSVTEGWRQAFEVGEDGGLLVVTRAPTERTAWTAVQGSVLLVTLLLAVPVRRRRGGTR